MTTRLPVARGDISIYPLTFDLQTRFGDQDVNGHINNVALARLFEDARIRFSLAIGGVPKGAGERVVVASIQIAYLAEASFPEPVRVGIGIVRIGTTSWTVAEAAFQDRACVAVAEATLALRDARGGMVLPALLRTAMEQRMIAKVG